MMHTAFQYWISQALRKKGDIRALSFIATMLPAKATVLQVWSILYAPGQSGQVSQLTLTWALTPLSQPLPEVCLNAMLYHDEITIPRATAAMAIPGTENKGDG